MFCNCCWANALFPSFCFANSTDCSGVNADGLVQYFTISIVGTVRGLEKTVWHTVLGTSLQVSEATSCGKLQHSPEGFGRFF